MKISAAERIQRAREVRKAKPSASTTKLAERLDHLAFELMAADKKLDYGTAMRKVIKANPELYARYSELGTRAPQVGAAPPRVPMAGMKVGKARRAVAIDGRSCAACEAPLDETGAYAGALKDDEAPGITCPKCGAPVKHKHKVAQDVEADETGGDADALEEIGESLDEDAPMEARELSSRTASGE